MLLCIAGARALAAGYLLVGFFSLWFHILVNDTGKFCRLVVQGTGATEVAFATEVEVGIGLAVCLIERRLLPLFLLAKNINCLSELW
jgi:hypothetical protein